MHRSIWIKSMMAAGMSLLLIAAFGYFSVSYFRTKAWQIVNDVLPGLSYSGAANASLAEAYENTLLFLVTTNASDCLAYRKAMDEASAETVKNLAEYEKSIFDSTDRGFFEALKLKRAKYLEVRERVLALSAAGQRIEALDEFKRSLQPAFKEYRSAGESLLKFNMAYGKDKGERIMKACTITQVLVALVGLGLFLLGFSLGLFR